MSTVSDPRRGFRLLVLTVFVISGFAGLIYESIWSHYLKLFLGHAAYAQTLVLALYMGGMALGAWFTGRLSARLKQPLLVYAGVELALGFAALAFHKIFVMSTGWAFDSVIPKLDSPLAVDLFKWSLGAALILPQCVLLGATFPLVSAGVIRTFPQGSGSSLSGLYFTNSLGAAVGVLASGFVLIALVGLPGTIMTAGLLNVVIALVVWAALKRVGETDDAPPLNEEESGERGIGRFGGLMLLVAFITGATSFMYEVGWIRMLSLVLGSATHSFELMLSAFILGIALGALLIRSRMDRLANPMATLAYIQLTMGFVAILTLPLYNQSFDWMAAVLKALAKTDQGYVMFNILSHLTCVAMMVPVTIFAGMTLPLITQMLIKGKQGEQAIGRVYAANTVGAIAGVLAAVHFVLPLGGLKSLVVLGSVGDFALGAALLGLAAGSTSRRQWGPVVLAGVVLVVVALGVKLDPMNLASGVFRQGNPRSPDPVVFHRDGKTSTVTVIHNKELERFSIANNGKVDAAITLKPPASADDSTMILAAAIPLSYRPDAKNVAVIGMGSGRSTHAFLEYPGLAQVDTIEIEPAVIEGARLFGPAVARAFEDSRSRMFIDDAKTFFSRHRHQYDIIMSEPSNPWVSGVASLFTREFYSQVKRKLGPRGLFVQWFQLYEIEPYLVASVMQALALEFADYVVYAADNGNLLILAGNEAIGPLPDRTDLGAGLTELLRFIGTGNQADIALRQIGNARVLAPFFASFGTPANSDYFPVLDQNAGKARYRQLSAEDLATRLHPVLWGLSGQAPVSSELTGGSIAYYSPAMWAQQARAIGLYFQWRLGLVSQLPAMQLDTATATRLSAIALIPEYCDESLLRAAPLPALVEYVHYQLPYAGEDLALPVADYVTRGSCEKTVAERTAWANVIRHVARKEHPDTVTAVRALLDQYVPAPSRAAREILVNLGMRHALLAGLPEQAQRLMEDYGAAQGRLNPSPALRALVERK